MPLPLNHIKAEFRLGERWRTCLFRADMAHWAGRGCEGAASSRSSFRPPSAPSWLVSGRSNDDNNTASAMPLTTETSPVGSMPSLVPLRKEQAEVWRGEPPGHVTQAANM